MEQVAAKPHPGRPARTSNAAYASVTNPTHAEMPMASLRAQSRISGKPHVAAAVAANQPSIHQGTGPPPVLDTIRQTPEAASVARMA